MTELKPRIRLRELRKQAGITQAMLAKKLSVSRQSIIAIEAGEYHPSLPLAFQIANFFNTDINNLFDYPRHKLQEKKGLSLKKGGYMPSIIPWSPLHEMREAIDRLMDESLFTLPARASLPTLNIHQTEKEVVVEANVPGYKEDELEVEISDNTLTISGKTEEKKEEKGKQYLHREWSTESFSRSITLPENLQEDKIEATLKDGILTVVIPKVKAEKPKVKKVKVSKK